MSATAAASAQRRASDILYEEIFASRNSNRRENIRVIKVVCDQMEKDRVVINAAEVSRRCGENGPAYSTISNKGSALGEYIKLRMTEQVATLKPVASGERSLADTVFDPVLAAQIRDKESTARWFRKENTALRHLLKSLTPGFDIDGALARVAKGQATTLIENKAPSADSVSNELKGLLLKLMDHLIGERQYEELRGRLTINRKIVLDPRELQVYRQTSGLSDDEWQKRYGADEGDPRGKR